MQPFAAPGSLKVMNQLADATDRQLAQSYLEGSEADFRQLYRRHTPRMRAMVLRLVGGAQDQADDVLQEAWLRACAALDRFRWESSLSTWLCGIGVHCALESLRRRRDWEDDRALEHLPSRAPLPSAERVDIERALAALPAKQRTVLVLHDIEGYTHEEIAVLMGTVAGTSKSQLSHAREALRCALV